MSIQGLRYNNCQLEYQSESGLWSIVPTLNNCADGLVIPSTSFANNRCRLALSLTNFIRQGTDAAVKTKRQEASATSAASTFFGLAASAIGLWAGVVTGGVSTALTVIAASSLVGQVSSSLANSFTNIILDEYDANAPLPDSPFWSEVCCHLYSILDPDTVMVTESQVQEWLHVIRYGVKESTIVAPHLRNIIGEQFAQQSLITWQTLGLYGQLFPTIADCATCNYLPRRIRTNVPSTGLTFYNLDGSVTLRGEERQLHRDPAIGGALLDIFNCGSYQFDYFTECFHITSLQATDFRISTDSDFANFPFAVYWPAGAKRTDPSISLTLNNGNTLQDLVGKDIAGFELRSYPDPNVPSPAFTVVIRAEPCCHDWREDGAQGWQEIGQTSPTNVVFDKIGLYGLIPTGPTVGVGAVYLQHNRNSAFKIHFEGEGIYTDTVANFTVAQSDTVPTSVPSTVIDADTDGYYLVTKPYVILAWNVTGAPSAGNPGTGNPVFTKFCYKPAEHINIEFDVDAQSTTGYTTPFASVLGHTYKFTLSGVIHTFAGTYDQDVFYLDTTGTHAAIWNRYAIPGGYAELLLDDHTFSLALPEYRDTHVYEIIVEGTGQPFNLRYSLPDGNKDRYFHTHLEEV